MGEPDACDHGHAPVSSIAFRPRGDLAGRSPPSTFPGQEGNETREGTEIVRGDRGGGDRGEGRGTRPENLRRAPRGWRHRSGIVTDLDSSCAPCLGAIHLVSLRRPLRVETADPQRPFHEHPSAFSKPKTNLGAVSCSITVSNIVRPTRVTPPTPHSAFLVCFPPHSKHLSPGATCRTTFCRLPSA